jgi:protein arginine N-methyltransferase 3
MLADKVRMGSFRWALEVLCKDKVVIDVGAGTGILSIMALDGGASHVFALEKSGIAREAEKAFKLRHDR